MEDIKYRVLPGSVVVGNYVTFRAHRLNSQYTEQWWKVTDIRKSVTGSYIFTLVSKSGSKREFSVNHGINVYLHTHSAKQNKVI